MHERFALFVSTAVLLALVGISTWLAETAWRDYAREQVTETTRSHLDQLRTNLEKVLAGDLYAVRGLATHIAIHPDLGALEFATYARRLIDHSAAVTHIALAPDLVVSDVYPRAGNEALIGVDYRTLPAQFETVMQAVERNAIVIAGPLDLIQGGTAFVARAPAFVSDGDGPSRLWGVIAAVIDNDALLREAGLHALSGPYAVALRGRDSSGAHGEAFLGDTALFDSDALTTRVALPSGSWQLAARPVDGWLGQRAKQVWVPRGIGLLIALLVVALAVNRDRFARQQAEALEAAREAEARFGLLFENVNDAVFINDAGTTQIIDVNSEALRYLGYTRAELLNMKVEDFFVPGPHAHLQDVIEEIRETGSAIFEARHRRADGGEVPVEVSARRVRLHERVVVISVVRDISERLSVYAALERSRQDLVNSIESIAEGFALWDRDDRLQIFNRRMLEIMPRAQEVLEVGVTFEEVLRHVAGREVVPHDGDAEQWLQERLQRHRGGRTALEFQTLAGRWVRLTENRTPDGYVVGIYQDITEIRDAQDQLRFRADFDALTGLPNRDSFMSQLNTTLRLAQRTHGLNALLFIDLDRFKNINDTMGHATGDRLLTEAAARIRASLRQTDTVARFGGDEFTVILRDIEDTTNAARIAENIIGRLSQAYEFDDQVFHAGASVGITVFPEDGNDAEVLLRNADMAMYQAKARGRNTYQFFTHSMTARAEQFVAIENDLRRSLREGDFVLNYQPVMDIRQRRVIGVEALVRWQHPQRGLVPPGDFIPVAEETHLITELGAWVLRRACEETREWWSDETASYLRLAVNVSSQQFLNGFDAGFIRTICAEAGLSPERLVIELTESLLIEEDERIAEVLSDIRDLGVALAIDDFGTGYSALGYLRRFPVTLLKIDRSFVRDIETDPNDAHLVESIIAMARALRIDVVAEGVESEGQAALLLGMGCETAQGFLYGRPQPAADFVTQWLPAPLSAAQPVAG